MSTIDLGNGFRDHGVATPISDQRGLVVTVDGRGRSVVLLWLFDHRGCYALLMIDADTGASEEFPVPFPPERDCPFASILSSRNRFYTHFNGHFVEFDPARRAFTFFGRAAPKMAMGMTEDDAGRIWAATYPDSGVLSFNPVTRELVDYGFVHRENWPQYQRSVAADDAGWIYFAVGNTASAIVAFDPATRTAKQIVPDAERGTGSAIVHRTLDGAVHGLALQGSDNWYELRGGAARRISAPAPTAWKAIITGTQGLRHVDFPDGRRLKTCDLVERVIEVESPTKGEVKRLTFKYSSDGAHLMGIATAPNGTLCGGTSFPMRFFSYDPSQDRWFNAEAYGQFNTVTAQGDRFFVGGYVAGFLLEWDPAKPWVKTRKDGADGNPRFFADCDPDIYRPHALLGHPDGKTIILAGTPGYGYTGGGLFIWDRKTRTGQLLKHTDLIPQHSVMSVVDLPRGRLLCGTTTEAGTGGERKAKVAELFVLDVASKRIEWHQPCFAEAAQYTTLCHGPRGLIYGFVDGRRFFVFDAEARKVVHDEVTESAFGRTNWQQGPRVFVQGGGETYILFQKRIGRVDPDSFAISTVVESPLPIGPGGDYHAGRIYFASGSHLCSYELSRRR